MSAKLLHVGCGRQPLKGFAAEVFRADRYQEIRVDIDPGVRPDIVSSMTDMSMIASGSVDGIFSSHNLEHLYPHEVSVALKEFLRVLTPNGMALITLPDLEQVARSILDIGLEDPMYHVGQNAVAALDVLYGYRPAMAAGNLYMAHRTGFSPKTLARYLLQAGFCQIEIQPDNAWSLWAVAYKSKPDPAIQLDVRRLVFKSSKQTVVYVSG